jgi:dUTPase
MDVLKFYRIESSGPGLTKKHSLDVGFDLHSSQNVTLEPGKISKIPTNVKVVLPDGTYGRVSDRSSLASKGVSVHGGVIDPNYTGEIICILSSLQSYEIATGDKIAQLILEKACICPMEELTVSPNAVDARGDGGLGSTGK